MIILKLLNWESFLSPFKLRISFIISLKLLINDQFAGCISIETTYNEYRYYIWKQCRKDRKPTITNYQREIQNFVCFHRFLLIASVIIITEEKNKSRKTGTGTTLSIWSNSKNLLVVTLLQLSKTWTPNITKWDVLFEGLCFQKC